MDNIYWALLLKPVAALVMFGCFGLPGRLLVQRYMKDGRLKRVLLLKIS